MVAETEDDLTKRLSNNKWKDNEENRGMKVNINKTNVILVGNGRR